MLQVCPLVSLKPHLHRSKLAAMHFHHLTISQYGLWHRLNILHTCRRHQTEPHLAYRCSTVEITFVPKIKLVLITNKNKANARSGLQRASATRTQRICTSTAIARAEVVQFKPQLRLQGRAWIPSHFQANWTVDQKLPLANALAILTSCSLAAK